MGRAGGGRSRDRRDARSGARRAPPGGRGGHLGWDRDGYVGDLPQPNAPTGDWATFYRDRRLAPLAPLPRSTAAGWTATPAPRSNASSTACPTSSAHPNHRHASTATCGPATC
ncbi:MAG: fructosamine kinase family protein [Acidimicrobiia bacterium]|nr:fructosamine kinase family protein [Acidimicrobiia bacterium]